MKNRSTLAAVGIIAVGLLAFVLVSQIAVEAMGPSSARRTRSVTRPQQPGTLQRTDESGNTWVLTLASGWSFNSTTEGAQPAALLTVKADVQRRGANEAAIGLILEGAGGERYRPVVMKNGTRLPAPGLRIVNEQGEVLAEGKFQYG